jgi:K+:H+ antiporter
MTFDVSSNYGPQLVFSMFVLEALVLTFATTPIVSYLYPPHLHTRATATGSSFVDVRDHMDDEGGIDDCTMTTKPDEDAVFKRRFTVVLDKLEHLPSLMAITTLLQPSSPAYSPIESTPRQSPGKEAEVSTHFGALRLIELSDRPSDLLKTSATDALLHTDPLIAIFRTFSELNGLPVSASLSIEPFESLATSVTEHVRVVGTQLVLVPWLPSALTPDNPAEHGAHNPALDRSGTPFDAFFRMDRSTSLPHSHFVRSVFAQAGTNVALLIGRAPFAALRGQTHVFLPFFGGPDDRLALDFVMQLCADPRVRATVIRMARRDVQAGVSVPEAARLSNEKDKEEENVVRNGLTITSLRSVRCSSLN